MLISQYGEDEQIFLQIAAMKNQLILAYVNETLIRDSMEILQLKMAIHQLDNGNGRDIKHGPIWRNTLSWHEQWYHVTCSASED